MKASITIAIVAAAIFFTGWAIRSSIPKHDWGIKPTGGALIAIGLLMFAFAMWRAIKNR